MWRGWEGKLDCGKKWRIEGICRVFNPLDFLEIVPSFCELPMYTEDWIHYVFSVKKNELTHS